MLLVDDLLLLPFKGFLGVLEKIHEMADRELNDEAYLEDKLLELRLLYEMDEISEAEYYEQAAEWEAKLAALGGEEDVVVAGAAVES